MGNASLCGAQVVAAGYGIFDIADRVRVADFEACPYNLGDYASDEHVSMRRRGKKSAESVRTEILGSRPVFLQEVWRILYSARRL